MRSLHGAPLLGVLVLFIAAACGDDPASSTDDVHGADGGDGSSTPAPPPGPKPPGSACASDDECESTCTGGKCASPTIVDGRISPSLGETDIDCGGAQAPLCPIGKGCASDLDCRSNVCGATKKCVDFRSCRATNGTAGIDTCGQGEVGEAGAAHESCCTSPLLPGSETRAVDRYKITAGRIREFISAMTLEGGGDPNIRAWALAYATAHPDSQLGQLNTQFPGYLEGTLPTSASSNSEMPLPLHLGGFPIDAINQYDGCFVGTGANGHATYWQEPDVLAPYGIGYGDTPDGKRKFSREILDTKMMNCMMPVMLATFCAWDGGELARTSDYRAIWGQAHQMLGATDVAVPWTQLLQFGQFNWENGHGGGCAIPGWPGCVDHSADQQPFFYQWPADGTDPSDDDTPTINPPGRFELDVSAAVSESDGRGWYDVAGTVLEVGWPADPHYAPAGSGVVCDTTASEGGLGPCARDGAGMPPAFHRPGVIRFSGPLPYVALFGYSFEGHTNNGAPYLIAPTDDPTKLAGYLVPMQFQYGKVDGRCARTVRP